MDRSATLPAPELVRNLVREAILKGELTAGAQLRQDELAQRFEISRIPVREALRLLEAEGLVTYHARRGAIVSAMSAEEISELFDIRIALECRALRLAVGNMTETDIHSARELLHRYDKEGNPSRWGEMNWKFHMTLYAPCDRPKLLSLIDANFGNVGRFIRLQVSKAAGRERPQQEHHKLVDLCAEQRIDEAVTLLEEHISYSQKVVRSSLRRPRS